MLLATASASLASEVVGALRREGIEARTSTEVGEALLEARRGGQTRVVVLDAELPGCDPLAFCREVRAAAGPQLLVIAGAGVAVDAVQLLDEGADDCITRAGRPRELVARVRALMRRPPRTTLTGPSVIAIGDVVLDTERHEVLVRGRPVALPLKQFQLLELFMTHPNQVLVRSTIIRRVWGPESLATSNTLEVHIKRLRRCIEEDPKSPTVIRTVRGIGYSYNARR